LLLPFSSLPRRSCYERPPFFQAGIALPSSERNRRQDAAAIDEIFAQPGLPKSVFVRAVPGFRVPGAAPLEVCLGKFRSTVPNIRRAICTSITSR
jgi:hypothetical protein